MKPLLGLSTLSILYDCLVFETTSKFLQINKSNNLCSLSIHSFEICILLYCILVLYTVKKFCLLPCSYVLLLERRLISFLEFSLTSFVQEARVYVVVGLLLLLLVRLRSYLKQKLFRVVFADIIVMFIL